VATAAEEAGTATTVEVINMSSWLFSVSDAESFAKPGLSPIISHLYLPLSSDFMLHGHFGGTA